MKSQCSVGLVIALACIGVGLSATSASAAILTATSLSADYLARQDGTNGTGQRVGFTGGVSAGAQGGRNGIFIFELPVLPMGDTFSTANLDFSVSAVSTAINIDLYFLTIKNSTAAIVSPYPYLQADTDANYTKLQDNILNNTTTTGGGAVYSTDALGDAALGAQLATFYSDNPLYAGGQYLFLRLNPDAPGSLGSSQGYLVNFNGDQTDSQLLPTLTVTTVPEPATWSLAMIGVCGLGYLTRRRKTAR